MLSLIAGQGEEGGESEKCCRDPPGFSDDTVGNKARPRTCSSPGLALSCTSSFSRSSYWSQSCRAPQSGTPARTPRREVLGSNLVPKQRHGARVSGAECDRKRGLSLGFHVPLGKEGQLWAAAASLLRANAAGRSRASVGDHRALASSPLRQRGDSTGRDVKWTQ